MNGAAIPLILWYFVTFMAEHPMAPIELYGPLDKAECQKLEDEQADKALSWCQGFIIRKPEGKK
jgi:hypothetical protein